MKMSIMGCYLLLKGTCSQPQALAWAIQASTFKDL